LAAATPSSANDCGNSGHNPLGNRYSASRPGQLHGEWASEPLQYGDALPYELDGISTAGHREAALNLLLAWTSCKAAMAGYNGKEVEIRRLEDNSIISCKFRKLRNVAIT
jgi:hypothetical protein